MAVCVMLSVAFFWSMYFWSSFRIILGDRCLPPFVMGRQASSFHYGTTSSFSQVALSIVLVVPSERRAGLAEDKTKNRLQRKQRAA
jgi:hypothetical protein